MTNEKYFLDFAGLAQYDKKIKKYIADNTADDANIAGLREEVLASLEALGNQQTATAEAVAANAAALEVLNGDGEGSIAKAVADAVSDVIGEAPEAFDTLKEIADWIATDETGTVALVERVATTEENIAALQTADTNMKEYVDTRDEYYYNLINDISNVQIDTLFLRAVSVDEGATVADTIAALTEGDMLVLEDDCAENLTIPANAVIDAKDHTFSGDLVVEEGATILNAVFTGNVIVGGA